ncbi:hypothetical protein CASFOL_015650 [Castilleja foliolosa]|uniref:Uncharacterized protein n=1 Tax=Castilleja foliolosa TaxID=1961234 RepID=A0ABD3DI63_9LAMI
MEGEKKQSAGSSLATELFGEKDVLPGSSSSGVFGSLFAPPSRKVLGRESEYWKKNGAGNQASNPKTGDSDANVVGGECQKKSSYFEDANMHPCSYSSSIYYGGQDLYIPPPKAPKPPVFTTFKDGNEDDSAGASRGNWWMGSYNY